MITSLIDYNLFVLQLITVILTLATVTVGHMTESSDTIEFDGCSAKSADTHV